MNRTAVNLRPGIWRDGVRPVIARVPIAGGVGGSNRRDRPEQSSDRSQRHGVAAPCAGVGRRSAEEVLCKLIIIRGVMSIQAGDNPRNLQAKLLTFIAPAVRADSDRQAA